MANLFSNLPVTMADKMLMYLDNDLKIGGLVNTYYKKDFTGGKGSTIQVPKPPKYEDQDGPAISQTQSINIGTVPVTVDTWKTVPIELSGLDLSMNFKAFSEWADVYLKPAASRLGNRIEQSLYGLTTQIPGFVGTAGTAPNAFDNIAAADEYLSWNDCPDTDRYCALSPHAWRTLGTGLTTLYNPREPIGELVKTGKVPNVSGFDTFRAQNVYSLTTGAVTIATTAGVSGASQTGSNINLASCGASKVWNKGEVFTISGVNICNPITKADTGYAQPFVVTSTTTGAAGGTVTLPIYPSIITSGAYQNVTASPANGSLISLLTGSAATTYRQNLAFHKNALGLVTVPIKAPDGLKSTTRVYKNIAVTISHGPDIMNFKEIWRADILFGTVVYYPELACRIAE